LTFARAHPAPVHLPRSVLVRRRWTAAEGYPREAPRAFRPAWPRREDASPQLLQPTTPTSTLRTARFPGSRRSRAEASFDDELRASARQTMTAVSRRPARSDLLDLRSSVLRASLPFPRGLLGRGPVACPASDTPCRALSPVIEPQSEREPGPLPSPSRQRQRLPRPGAPSANPYRPPPSLPSPPLAQLPRSIRRPPALPRLRGARFTSLARGASDARLASAIGAIREHVLESPEPWSARRYEKGPKPLPMIP
jgi:hypothetical protein